MRLSLLACLAALLALALAAPAVALTRHSSERALRQKLADRYGGAFTDARAHWLKCPREEIYDADGDGYREAYCMAEFGSGRARRFVEAGVDDDLSVKIYFTRHWKRGFHHCPRRYLRAWHGHGRVRANSWDCPGAAQLASDVNRLVQRHPRRRRANVYWHGTNTLGFAQVARLRCRIRRHGQRRRAICRNALGDAFVYRFSVGR